MKLLLSITLLLLLSCNKEKQDTQNTPQPTKEKIKEQITQNTQPAPEQKKTAPEAKPITPAIKDTPQPVSINKRDVAILEQKLKFPITLKRIEATYKINLGTPNSEFMKIHGDNETVLHWMKLRQNELKTNKDGILSTLAHLKNFDRTGHFQYRLSVYVNMVNPDLPADDNKGIQTNDKIWNIGFRNLPRRKVPVKDIITKIKEV